jgi:hypothetical protein
MPGLWPPLGRKRAGTKAVPHQTACFTPPLNTPPIENFEYLSRVVKVLDTLLVFIWYKYRERRWI